MRINNQIKAVSSEHKYYDRTFTINGSARYN